MTYNPNQARNSKGSPLAGAWAADNQRAGASAVSSQAWLSDGELEELVEAKYREASYQREMLRPLLEERFLRAAEEVDPNVRGIMIEADDEGGYEIAVTDGTGGNEDWGAVADHDDLSEAAYDLAHLDGKSGFYLMPRDGRFENYAAPLSERRIQEKIAWANAALHTAGRNDVVLEVEGSPEDGYDFLSIDEKLLSLNDELHELLPDNIDQNGVLRISRLGRGEVMVTYAVEGGEENLQSITGRPGRVPINADEAVAEATLRSNERNMNEGSVR